jgi:hypothetical protein
MGASNEDQMIDNLGAVKVIDKLTPGIMTTLNNIMKLGEEHKPPGFSFRPSKSRHSNL